MIHGRHHETHGVFATAPLKSGPVIQNLGLNVKAPQRFKQSLTVARSFGHKQNAPLMPRHKGFQMSGRFFGFRIERHLRKRLTGKVNHTFA